jgi:SOS-response transcriptional repressor LexA
VSLQTAPRKALVRALAAVPPVVDDYTRKPVKHPKSQIRHGQIIDAIRTFHQVHGYAPNIREVMALTGYRSTSAVQYQLRYLRDQGRVQWNPKVTRSIHVVEPACFHCGGTGRAGGESA